MMELAGVPAGPSFPGVTARAGGARGVPGDAGDVQALTFGGLFDAVVDAPESGPGEVDEGSAAKAPAESGVQTSDSMHPLALLLTQEGTAQMGTGGVSMPQRARMFRLDATGLEAEPSGTGPTKQASDGEVDSLALACAVPAGGVPLPVAERVGGEVSPPEQAGEALTDVTLSPPDPAPSASVPTVDTGAVQTTPPEPRTIFSGPVRGSNGPGRDLPTVPKPDGARGQTPLGADQTPRPTRVGQAPEASGEPAPAAQAEPGAEASSGERSGTAEVLERAPVPHPDAEIGPRMEQGVVKPAASTSDGAAAVTARPAQDAPVRTLEEAPRATRPRHDRHGAAIELREAADIASQPTIAAGSFEADPQGSSGRSGGNPSGTDRSRRETEVSPVTGSATPVTAAPAPQGAGPGSPELRPAGSTLTPETGEQVNSQIVQSLRTQLRGGIGEAVVRLRPDFLGEVTITVKVERGAVEASVKAELPAVREWLEAQEPAVRQSLQEQGLSLSRLRVEPDERRDGDQGGQEPPRQDRRARQQPKDEQRFELLV